MTRFLILFMGCFLLCFGNACSKDPSSSPSPAGAPWDATTIEGKTGGAHLETLFGNTNEAQGDPCLGMNADGICAGSSLEDCKGAHIVEADCTQRCGGFCISHPITEHPACLCPEGVDSCEGIPEGGACQLNVLLRCVQGTLLGIDCGAQGLTCFPGAEGLGAGCGEDGVFDECGAVPSEGGCDGELLIRCEQGQLLFEDCAIADQSCIWSDENAMYLCQSP